MVAPFQHNLYKNVFGLPNKMVRMSSCGQQTRGGPPVWGLGKELTTNHKINEHIKKCYTGPWACRPCEHGNDLQVP